MYVVQQVEPEVLLKFFREEKLRYPGEIHSNWGYKALWRKKLYTVSANGAILGYAIINEWGTDKKRLMDELYISPEYRSAGLGRCLFKFARPDELVVDGSNEGAIRFYSKMGLRKSGSWKKPDGSFNFIWLTAT